MTKSGKHKFNKSSHIKKVNRHDGSKWLKNALKSIGSTATNSLKDIYPTLYEVGSTGANVSRGLVSGIRSNKNNLNRISSGLSSNKYITAARTAYKNALEDLANGNFDNSERMTDAFMNSSSDGDDGGYDNFFSDYDNEGSTDFSFGDEDEDLGSSNYTYIDASDSSGTQAVLSTVSSEMSKNTRAQIETAKANMDATIAIASSSMFQMESIGREVIDHLSNISTSLTTMVEYNNENMTKFIESSMAFYERMGVVLDDEYNYGSDDDDDKVSFETLFNGTKGGLNLSEYKTYLKKSLKNSTGGGALGMIDDMLSEENLQMLAANPLGMLTKGITDKVIPKIMGKTLKGVEDTLSTFIPTMLGRLTKQVDEYDMSWTGKLKKNLASIFGIKSSRDTEIHAEAKINKGPVPFDGETKHAITEIITKELRNQSSYLKAIASKMRVNTEDAENNAEVFDYTSGRYIRRGDIQSQILSELKDSVISAFTDNKFNKNEYLSRESFGSQLTNMIESIEDDKSRETMQKGVEQLFLNLTRSDANYFEPGKANDEDWKEVIDKINIDKKAKDELLSYINEMREKTPTAFYDLTRSIHVAREAYTDKLKDINEDPTQYNLWATSLNGREDLDDLIDKEFKYGSYGKSKDAKLGKKYARPELEDIDVGEGLLSRGVFGIAANGVKDSMLALMKGNTSGFEQTMVDTSAAIVSRIGTTINDKIVSPFKNILIGSDENPGGILEPIKNRFSDFGRAIKYSITGEEYTDSEGTVHVKTTDSLMGNLKSIGLTIRDGIKEKIFGKKELDENGEPIESETIFGKIKNELKSGWDEWMDSFFGKPDTEETKEDRKKRLKQEFVNRAPDAATGAVIGTALSAGAGSSILGSLMLGPIGGAVIGTAVGFASRSEGFQKALFGEKDEETGERMGGIISAETQKFFKDNKAVLGGGAAIGATTAALGITNVGILGNLVGGPVAGALLGLGTGIIAKSGIFKKMLFGDEKSGQKGLINGIKDAWNKHAKKRDAEFDTAGKKLGYTAIGTGAGMTAGLILSHGILGASLGPAGIVGGALAGLAVSIKSQGKSIREWFFGKDYYDENGEKRHHKGTLGQIGNELKASIINPLKTQVKYILGNVANDVEHNFLMPLSFIAEDISGFVSKKFHAITNKLSSGMNAVGKVLFQNTLGKVALKIGEIGEKVFEKGSEALYTMFSLPGQVLRKGVEIVHNRVSEFIRPAKDFFKVVRKRVFDGIGNVFKFTRNLIGSAIGGVGKLLKLGVGKLFGGIGRRIANSRVGRATKRLREEFDVGGIRQDIGDRVRLNREEYKDKKAKLKARRNIDKAHDRNAKLISQITRGQYAEDTEEAREYARTLDSKFDAKLAKVDAVDTEKRKMKERTAGRSSIGMSEIQLIHADIKALDENAKNTSFLAKIWYVISGQQHRDKKEEKRRKKNGEPLSDDIQYNDKGVPMVKYDGEFYTKKDLIKKIGKDEAEQHWGQYKGKFVNQDPNLAPDDSDGESLTDKLTRGIGGSKGPSIKDQFKNTINEYKYISSKKQYDRAIRRGDVPVDDNGRPISFEAWALSKHKRFMHGEGYAEGTGFATPGIHPINEKGEPEIIISSGKPQLRSFKGGETVLPTDKPLAVYITDVSKEAEDKIGPPEEETKSEKAKRLDKEQDTANNAKLKELNAERRRKAIEAGLNEEEKRALDKKGIKETVSEAVTTKAAEVKETVKDKLSGLLTMIKPALKVGLVALLAKFFGIDWGTVTGAITTGANFLADNIPKLVDFAGGAYDKIKGIAGTVGNIAGFFGKSVKNAVETVGAVTNSTTEQKEFAEENASTSADTGTATGKTITKGAYSMARVAMNPTAAKTGLKIAGKTVGTAAKGSFALARKAVPTAVKVGDATLSFVAPRLYGVPSKIVKNTVSTVKNSAAGKIVKEAAQRGTAVLKHNAGKGLETVADTLKSKGDDLLKKVIGHIEDFFKIFMSKLKSSKLGKKLVGKVSTKSLKYGPKTIISFVKNKWASLTGKIAGKLGLKGTAAASTAGISEAIFITAGAINGLSGAARLFQIDEENVDTIMKVISTIIGGFRGSTVGTIFDVINEVFYAFKGVDLYNSIACGVYRLIAGAEKYDDLEKNKESFKDEYVKEKDEKLEQQYETQKKAGLIGEDVTLEEFNEGVKEGKYKADYQSFEDYNNEKNATLSTKAWNKVKSVGKGISNGVKNVKEFFTGKKETRYTDDNGNVYTKNDDGTYQVKDSDGKDLGYVSKDALPENLKKETKTLTKGTNFYAKKGFNLAKNKIKSFFTGEETEDVEKANAAVKQGFSIAKDKWNTFWNKITNKDSKKSIKDNIDSVLNKKDKEYSELLYYVKTDNYMTYYKKDKGKDTFTKYNLDGTKIETGVSKDKIDELLRGNLLRASEEDKTDKDNTKLIDKVKKSFGNILGTINKNLDNSLKDLNNSISSTPSSPVSNAINVGASIGTSILDNVKSAFGGRGDGKSFGGHGPSTMNGFSYYSQNDSSWADDNYGNDGAKMADSGCGPTAMSMVASEMTGQNITPTDAARLAEMTGDRDETGTNWNYINKASGAYGLSSKQELNPSASDIAENLSNGNPMILSGRTGGFGNKNSAFTKAGHYVVATGIDDKGNVEINDPRGPQYSGKKDLESVANETGSGWSFGGFGKKKSNRKNNKKKENNITVDNTDRSSWIQTVESVKKAIADKKCGYSQTTYTDLTINGKSYTMRPDCSGFTQFCLFLYGKTQKPIIGLTSYGFTDMNNGVMKKTGFTPRKFSSWDNLDKGDIIATNGHVEIFSHNENGAHYVYNVGSNNSANDPNPTRSGHSSYTTVWAPTATGNAINYSGGTTDATTAETNAVSLGTSDSPNIFSAVSSIMASAATKAMNGIATGVFDTDFSNDISAAITGSSSSSSYNSSNSTSNTSVGTDANLSISGSSNAEKIWNFFTNNGFSPAATAGIMGNAQQESGLDPKKKQYGGGPGRGIFQWEINSGRFNELTRVAKKNGTTWDDLGSQLQHALNEMNTQDINSRLSKSYSIKDIDGSTVVVNPVNGLQGFKGMTNPEEATKSFEAAFERAGKPNFPNRIKSANTFYKMYSDGSAKASIDDKSSKKKNNKTKTKVKDNKKKGGKGEGSPSVLNSGYNFDNYEDRKDNISKSNNDYNVFKELNNYGGRGKVDHSSGITNKTIKLLEDIVSILESIDKSSLSSSNKLDALNELKKDAKNSISKNNNKNSISKNQNNTDTQKVNKLKEKHVTGDLPSVGNKGPSKNEILARQIAAGGF